MSSYKISFFARQFIANDRWLYKIIKLAPASNVRHRRIFAALRARSSTIVTYKARVHELHTLGKPPAPASASSACRNALSTNLATLDNTDHALRQSRPRACLLHMLQHTLFIACHPAEDDMLLVQVCRSCKHQLELRVVGVWS